MAHIFICGDRGQAALLARAEAALRASGHTITRGPAEMQGIVRRYSEAEGAALLDAADVAVFTVRHECSRALMASAPRLRGVCYPTIGVESLDLAAADELGIIVGHGAVRGNVVGVAEATVMLMLMLLTDVCGKIRRVKAGQWRAARHTGHQLEGKTVGLLGFGRIAREVALRLQPFGANILTTSPRLRAGHVPRRVRKVPLETLLAESDLVSILTGLSPETRNLIGAEQIALMKPSAFLVNTGRGAIVDELALTDALRSGAIRGAALDTFSVEPLPADSPLRTLDNVILTPHSVGHTMEGEDEFIPAMLINIERMLAGEVPLYCKNPRAEPAWRARLRLLDRNATLASA